MYRSLIRPLESLRTIALAIDAGHAIRHGLPVSEQARRHCAPAQEYVYVPHSWVASEMSGNVPSPRS